MFSGGDVAVDSDGFITFTGLFGYLEGTPLTIYEDITIHYELQLIGVASEGKTSIKQTLHSSTTDDDSFISSTPTFNNGNIYLTTNKGYINWGEGGEIGTPNRI